MLYEQDLHPDFAVDELMFSFFRLTDCFVVLEDLLKPCWVSEDFLIESYGPESIIVLQGF